MRQKVRVAGIGAAQDDLLEATELAMQSRELYQLIEERLEAPNSSLVTGLEDGDRTPEQDRGEPALPCVEGEPLTLRSRLDARGERSSSSVGSRTAAVSMNSTAACCAAARSPARSIRASRPATT